MSGIRRVSQLGTTGESTYVDGSIQTADIADGAIATIDIAANAVTQEKLSTDIPLSGMRNAIINGDFRVWQRGTSIGGYAYTADRWLAYQAATVNTISRQAASLSGFQYCARVQRNSGATNTGVHYLVQAVETINSYRFQGMTATLSFYARAGANYSSASSLLGANIETSTGVDQSYIAAWAGGVAVTSSKTLTTSWQRFTVTGAVPAGATQVGVAFSYTPVGTAGANDYFEVTGVQLEVAPQATPFEQRPIGVELALCQRYYERINGIGSGSPDWAMIGSGGWDSTTNFSCTYVYKTTKRARPSVFSSPTGINCLYHGIAWYGSSSVGYSEISINAVRMNYTITGGSAVQGQAGVAVFATSSAYVEVNAEL